MPPADRGSRTGADAPGTPKSLRAAVNSATMRHVREHDTRTRVRSG